MIGPDTWDFNKFLYGVRKKQIKKSKNIFWGQRGRSIMNVKLRCHDYLFPPMSNFCKAKFFRVLAKFFAFLANEECTL